VRVCEEPAGGGPVAAAAAGLAALVEIGADAGDASSAGVASTAGDASTADTAGVDDAEDVVRTVALLAADLPFLDPGAVTALRSALDKSTVDGVVFVDPEGRRQTLCGVWRTAALRAALDGLGPPAGASIRALLAGLRVGELRGSAEPPPWYDCDQPDDLLRAEEWIR
jgi:molybdopterin-guanine dinucleotide biosynthesis protein A